MLCKKCGAEISDRAFVCTNCGEVLRDITVPVVEKEGSAVEDTAPLWFLADDDSSPDTTSEPAQSYTDVQADVTEAENFVETTEVTEEVEAAEESEEPELEFVEGIDEEEPQQPVFRTKEAEAVSEEETKKDFLAGEDEEVEEVHFIPMQDNHKKSRMELLLEKANKALKANEEGKTDDDNYMFITDEESEETKEEEEQKGSKMAQLADANMNSDEEEESDAGFRTAILTKRKEEAKQARESFVVNDDDDYLGFEDSVQPKQENENASFISEDSDSESEAKEKNEAPTRLSRKERKKLRMTYKVFNKITPLTVIVSVFLSCLMFVCISCLLICLSTQNSSLTENTRKVVEEMNLEAKYGDTAVGKNINFEFLTTVISHSVTPVLIGLYVILIIYIVSLLLRVNIVNQKLTLLYSGIPCIVAGSILYEGAANYDVFAKMICDMLNVNDYISELICKVLSDILADLALISVLVGIVLCVLLTFFIIVEIIRTPNRGANEQTIHRRVFGD